MIINNTNQLLVNISAETYPILIDMRYASSHNFTGHKVYADNRCALRPEAAACLHQAAVAARMAGLTIKVLDAYRPAAAQQVFWELCPDPRYVADPSEGSNHTRGVAVDVTLVNAQGKELDMGTDFDYMHEESHHSYPNLPEHVQRNRLLLLGIMLNAGFCPMPTEWWHYQLPNTHKWSLINNWPE